MRKKGETLIIFFWKKDQIIKKDRSFLRQRDAQQSWAKFNNFA